MPLILLCGLPCSGKTTAADKLIKHLQSFGLEVLVVSDESVGLERGHAYTDGHAEKKTRALLKAAVDRSLRGDRYVILDSQNSIKGYRYELWCLAKAAKTRYCLVHCDVGADICRQWNTAERWPEKVFEDLASRFEMPSIKNRWDVPMFRISPQNDSMERELKAAVDCITGKKAIQQAGIPLASETMLVTENPELSSTNLLNELDRTAQRVVSVILDRQAQVGGEAAGSIDFDSSCHLNLRRPVTLPELRRLKRAFLKLSTQNGWTRVQNMQQAEHLFIEYLQDHIEQ